ncbi:MAG: hypothetical protein K2O47_05420 [Muribaculaceae bacterium]|nr:hypothetical protein [Muribaculaceae bacterium]
MEILPLHIEYLLTRHDCVIVPGFGAFIASEADAHFDMDNGIVMPRRREISFNSSVVTDDGLLSHSIARREHLSYEEAHRYMTALIDKMSNDLRHEGEVSLGMVGRLAMDTEGFINFVPRHSSALADILTDINLSRCDECVMDEKSEEATAASFENETDEDGMRTIRVAPDRYVFTVSKRAVHAAAMIIAVFTIGLSLLIPINHDNEQKASVISIEELLHHAMKDNLLNKADSVSCESTGAIDNCENADNFKKNE